jgi:FkbM family methyltransferase
MRRWIVLLAALGAGWIFRDLIGVAVLSALGRNPMCAAGPALKEHWRVATSWKDAGVREIRRDGDLTLWRTPLGEMWAPKNTFLDINVREQVLDYYGPLRKGDVVLDCGANIGLFTRKALDAGARRVISIEPSPEILECLRRNHARDIAAGRVVVVPEGVWDSVGKVTFQIDDENRGADRFTTGKPEFRRAFELPVTTVDALVEKLGLDRVDFIKMDIEGAEVRALRGARATLARFRPRMAIAAYHKSDDGVNIPRAARAGNPAYTAECGLCQVEWNASVRPVMLFFR